MSQERALFDTQAIPTFFSYLKVGNSILDIGKSNDNLSNFYKEKFPNMIYKTLDSEPRKNPDIVDDIENTKLDANSFDAIICMGVWEMCDNNPFDLYKGIMKVLKPKGYFLFGIKLTGFPVDWNFDWFRFTVSGVKKLLKNNTILDEFISERDNIHSYIFIIGKK